MRRTLLLFVGLLLPAGLDCCTTYGEEPADVPSVDGGSSEDVEAGATDTGTADTTVDGTADTGADTMVPCTKTAEFVDGFERSAPAALPWSSLAADGAATLTIDPNRAADGTRSLHVELANAAVMRGQYLLRELGNVTCAMSFLFALYIDTLPPPNNRVTIVRADVSDGFLDLDLDANGRIVLRESSTGVFKEIASKTLPAGVWTPIRFSVSKTSLAVAIDNGVHGGGRTLTTGAVTKVKLGAVAASPGPAFDFHVDGFGLFF